MKEHRIAPLTVITRPDQVQLMALRQRKFSDEALQHIIQYRESREDPTVLALQYPDNSQAALEWYNENDEPLSYDEQIRQIREARYIVLYKPVQTDTVFLRGQMSGSTARRIIANLAIHSDREIIYCNSDNEIIKCPTVLLQGESKSIGHQLFNEFTRQRKQEQRILIRRRLT